MYPRLYLFLLAFILVNTGRLYAQNSHLANGTIYSIEIPNSGIYQLSYAFLSEKLGISPNQLTKQNISILGNKGGMLPETIGNYDNNGLFSLPILWHGNNNEQFEPGEKIIFYAEGPEVLQYNGRYRYEKNIYDDKNYCFIKIGAAATPISTASTDLTPNASLETYDLVQTIETDNLNLLHDFTNGTGTGKKWFMTKLEVLKKSSFNFEVPKAINGGNYTLYPSVAVRSGTSSSMAFQINNENFSSSFSSTNLNDIEATYAFYREPSFSATNLGQTVDVEISYPNAGQNRALAWIDQVMLVADAALEYANTPLYFSKAISDIVDVQIANASNELEWWDISDMQQPLRLPFESQNTTIHKVVDLTTFRKFALFNPNNSLPEPTFVGPIDNQDILPNTPVDLLVVYPAAFEEAASKFVQHRSSYSQLNVKAVSVEHIYNEFSAGRKDLIAIRDYVKWLYDLNGLKSLMLLGDGSFDEREIYKFDTKSNWIPTFQTANSFSIINGYTSDDIFGLLETGEGASDKLTGDLDIAVGRIPVRSDAQALQMVDKIIAYDLQSDIGNWQNRITFIADDEDNNIHLNQANRIADQTAARYANLNVNKIFFDAYEQISTAGGQKYPAVTEATERALFSGTLVVNYMGHGGPTSLSQERFLRKEDVQQYTNLAKLPLFITATCSFTGFDDPSFSSAGEELLLNPRGGAIALFTTVRSVFSSSNERLTRAVFDQLFELQNGTNLSIGEILRKAKNQTPSENSRKFLLIGDPSIGLKLPTKRVVTKTINDQAIENNQDTVGALQKVVLAGEVQDEQGNLLFDFNGEVSVTVFDKPSTIQTRGQDNTSFVTDFELQQTIIFQGRATVSAGKFNLSFIVPKDIDTEHGLGKISYFATAQNAYASGANQLVIGGISNTPLNDTEGPEIKIFMNTLQFRDGGTTNENPLLLVQLADSSGINISGVRIGHDIKATLNDQSSYILNEAFEASMDSYKTGTVTYPLFNLDEGPQTIRIKAWDVANNSNEESLSFVVVHSDKPILKQLISYPNPFTDQTKIYMDHNLSGMVNYELLIFDAAGRQAAIETGEVMTNGEDGSVVIFPKAGNNPLTSGLYYYQIRLINPLDGKKYENKQGKFIVVE